jgi:non-specific protein-tyrosine kinase
MVNPELQPTPDLREYLRIIRARRVTVLLVVFSVLALSLLLSFRQTPLYRSEARLLIDPRSSAFGVATVDMATQREIATSDPVAEAVRRELDLSEPATDVLGGLDVQQVGDTRVLAISYTSTDPQKAQRVAEAFTNGFIAYQTEEHLRQVTAERQGVERQVDDASEQLADVTARLREARSAGDAALEASLARERDALVARLGVLQQRLLDVLGSAAEAATSAQVIEAARLPSQPFAPNHLRAGVLGLFFGVALGLALAFLRERLADRVKDRGDIETALQAPALAAIPRYRLGKDEEFTPVTLAHPAGGASEVYRSLRTSLQFAASHHGYKSVVVTSATAGEGKSVTTANLGIVLAQAGQRVVLVSADLRRPSLERYFGLRGARQGLSTWLASDDPEPWDVVLDPGIKNLRLVPSGPAPSNPAELLGSKKMHRLITLLEENADLVLIDSPPVLAVADAAVMGRYVGASLLVINADSTHKSTAVRGKEEVERTGGVLLGAVLNGIDATTSSYYYYASNYSSHKQEPVSEVKEKKTRRKRGKERAKASN